MSEKTNFKIPTTTSPTLLGVLNVSGVGSYYLSLKQCKNYKIWTLYEYSGDINEVPSKIVACLKIFNGGKILGTGQVNIIFRVVDLVSDLSSKAILRETDNKEYIITDYEYVDEATGNTIRFETFNKCTTYENLTLKADGLSVFLSKTKLQVKAAKDKEMEQVIDERTKTVVISNLGIKTLAMLRKIKGRELDFLDLFKFHLVDNDLSFSAMMTAFLDKVQAAHYANKAILLGLDTETTGLNMFNLSPNNPYRDHIVAIPFSWENDSSYLICMDMANFNNVSDSLVYDVFDKLFKRNKDFSDSVIELDWNGKHYKFNRNNIIVAGYNSMFDRMAFMCHNADVYFDEDGMILMYDQAPGLVKGHNGLKDWTHAMTGYMTLELEELFGKQHKDKFRYLQDKELAKAYGCADSLFTRVVVKNGIRISNKEVYLQYKKYDIPLMNILAKAAWNGVPIDSEAVREQGKLVEKDLDTIMNFIYSYTFNAYSTGFSDKVDSLANILKLNKKSMKDHIDEILEQSEKEKMFRFEFTPANLKHLLFGTLSYPVKERCDNGSPKMDKNILNKLAKVKLSTPSGVLKHDVVSSYDEKNILISAKDFNSDKYPLARVLLTYATINKEYTSYYKPILNHDLEGKVFYPFNMAFAATRRILSPGQTMKGALKKLVKAPKGQLTLCFDASQIEFRLMASEAYLQTRRLLKKKYPQDWEERLHKTNIYETYLEMQKEEADYHIQTAAQMTKTKRHFVKAKDRKTYKQVGFGIPYGLTEYSLCERLFGKVTPELLAETKMLMKDYETKQAEIIRLLETTRDDALKPSTINTELREWLGLNNKNVGCVYNLVGFKYSYLLSNLSTKNTERIRRQAGNCKIQGGAAELFRRMLMNFYMGCVKEGIEDKVNWFMIVHDEVDCNISQDIDVIKLIKIIHQNCTLRYENQIPYYVGIGLGHNWGEAKDDAAELPVIMVERLIDAYDNKGFRLPVDGNQPEYLLQLKRHYLCDRIEDCLKEIIPSLNTGHIWTDEEIELVNEQFENYIARAYLSNFIPKELSKRLKAENRDATLREQLESWQQVREEYGFGVPFTATKFKSIQEEVLESIENITVNDMDLGLDISFDDLKVELKNELLEGNDIIIDYEQLGSFTENDLFDFRAVSTEDAEFVDTTSEYGDDNDDEEYVLNDNPTSSFDVLVSKKYTRKNITKSNDTTYIVRLNNTIYKDFASFKREVKSHITAGISSFLVIDDKVRFIEDLDLNDTVLDKVDKVLCGTESW